MFKLNYKYSLLLALLISTIIYSQNPTLNENSIKFESSQVVSLVGENGLIMRSTNNGQNWEEQNSNISNVLYGLSVSNGVSLASGENGVILRSSDNGNTWDPILPGTLENLNSVEIMGSNAIVCGNNGTIYYSTDAGLTWQEVTSVTANDLKDVNLINETVGFITGELGTLLKTIDGGRTWTEQHLTFTGAKFNSVEAINENKLILVGDEGMMFLSDNGGVSWYGANSLMYENNFNDVVFFDELNGIIAADNGLMLKTIDGGASWQAATVNVSGTLYDFKSVAFYNSTNGISVGTQGIEIFSTDGGATWTENGSIMNSVTNGSKTIQGLNIKNYPNPFNPTTNITYELPVNANVTVKIYDASGKETSELFSGYQQKGNHTLSFNAGDLSSGVYFYKLTVTSGELAGFTEVRKMILTK